MQISCRINETLTIEFTKIGDAYNRSSEFNAVFFGRRGLDQDDILGFNRI